MREKFTADRLGARGRAELVDEAERRSGRSADDEASALLDTSQSTGLIQDLLRRRLTRPGRRSARAAPLQLLPGTETSTGGGLFKE